jgi:hypothetical protein
LKKYSVYILLSNGKDIQFETDTDVENVPTVHINGGDFIKTVEDHLVNVNYIKEMNVVKLR